MKYLGIDYGTKNIGIAISDEIGNIAFPKKIIQQSNNLIQDILNLIKEEDIAIVVVGKSFDPWGSENLVQKKINIFIKKLSCNFDGDIVEQDERGSSIAAASHLYSKGNIANEKWTGKSNAKKREHNDANAAAVILQRYLDRKKDQ